MYEQLTLFDRDSEYMESVVDVNDDKASFRVHASLIYKLGESLIADEVTALSELIKNSYDADAKICALTIKTNYIEKIRGRNCRGYIEIADDGCGMNLTTIVNGWLTLSNSPKKKMKKNKETTPKYHRYPLGDKGLGRLSVQKLGRYMQMMTKVTDESVEYCVTIPWGEFLKNTTIDQIPVSIEKKPISSKRSYTKIIIKDLIDPDMWAQPDQIDLLTNSISKIVSPFRSEKNNFLVSAQIDTQSVDIDNKVFDELLLAARAKHVVKYKSGAATITSYYRNSFFYNREVLPKVVSGEFTLSETAITDYLKINETRLPKVKKSFKEGYSLIEEDNCIFPSIAAPVSKIEKIERIPDKEKKNTVNTSGKKVYVKDPGEFECEIYEYSLDKQFLDHMYTNIEYKNLIEREEFRDFIDRYHGIKVVRDGFVIQGFGEGDGGDWLGLSVSSKTKGNYIDLKNDNVIGCVYLTGVANSDLKETTSREGFVDDEFFRGFKEILTGSVKRINRNRKKLNDLMKKYVVNSIDYSGGPSNDILGYESTIEQIREKLSKTDTVLDSKVTHIDSALLEYDKAQKVIAEAPFFPPEAVEPLTELYKHINAASEDYQSLLHERDDVRRKLDAINLDFEKMSERIRNLFELAGLGLSVEMFTHEFDSSIRRIRLKNQQIIANKSTQTVDSMARHINYVTFSLDALRKQMSYFNPGLKYVRAEKQKINIKEFIETHRSFYIERCRIKNIEFITDVRNSFDVRINRGMLNQVFDNLFSNSEYWLDYSVQKGLIEKKQYNIFVQEKGIIIVWDNGIGISPDLETRLFEPFETKKENGRGLGLYIAAENLKYSSSRIRLLHERNSFGNLFKFEIDVSQVTQ